MKLITNSGNRRALQILYSGEVFDNLGTVNDLKRSVLTSSILVVDGKLMKLLYPKRIK